MGKDDTAAILDAMLDFEENSRARWISGDF